MGKQEDQQCHSHNIDSSLTKPAPVHTCRQTIKRKTSTEGDREGVAERGDKHSGGKSIPRRQGEYDTKTEGNE